MKRHSSLVSLSHDHHHALVRARQLRRAAQGETAVRRAEAASFVTRRGHRTRGRAQEVMDSEPNTDRERGAVPLDRET